MCRGSVPVKNVVLHITYLLAQEEVEHIFCVCGYALHSSGNNYILNLNSLIPMSTYPGSEGKPREVMLQLGF